VSFDGLLVHTATVKERTGETDRFGQPVDRWRVKHENVPCRLMVAKGTQRTTLVSNELVEVTHMLYTTGEDEIAEGDLVVVEDADGEVVADGLLVLVVERVSKGAGGRHHAQYRCQQAKS
jgi:hypothetical protein